MFNDKLSGQKNFNIALADNSGFSDFYVKSNSTDSSLIEPAGGYTNKINVKTITLDQFCADNNVEKIKLFKLEAEGSEPEILNGSRKAIKKIEYVALDGGAERGKNKETTIEYCTNFLSIIILKKFFIKSTLMEVIYVHYLKINYSIELYFINL